MDARRTVWLGAALALLLGVIIVAPAGAYDRMVLCEEFTATWEANCQVTGEGLSQLLDENPADLALVQIHYGDLFATAWGDARAIYHGVSVVPTTVFDGTGTLSGGVGYAALAQAFGVHNSVDSELEIHFEVQQVGAADWQFNALLCLDPNAVGRDVEVHMVQVLDYWPPSPAYHRNGLKQAAMSETVFLPPGGCNIMSRVFSFDAESMATPDAIKVICWAEEVDGSGQVVQAAQSVFPFVPDCIPVGDDCWSTACGATFAEFDEYPIPADFFGPGSDPFDGRIYLGGPNPGAIDTVVSRLDELCFSEPYPSTDTVPVELVSLNLVSCQPITVGGAGQWTVQVGLSGIQPQGTITVTKESASGGTFSVEFFVQPVYVFTNVNDPGDQRTLDTGLQGLPPIYLQTVFDADWTSNELYDVCSLEGFYGGGSNDPYGDVCCDETCHSAGPGSPHLHCTRPAGCPPCGACCLPDGTCVRTSEISCLIAFGAYLGDGTTCDGDFDFNGVDDACELPDVPCGDCPPGLGWLPNCLGGYDLMPSTAAVGVDLNLDCYADWQVDLEGPVVVRRTDPLDDSLQFPGLAPLDGHLDVVDTEIISMTLSSPQAVLVAGAGSSTDLQPTLGAAVERMSDPFHVDSFFDVYFEIDLGNGMKAYNHDPVRVEAVLDCMPPDVDFIFPVSCLPLYDSPIPGSGFVVAQLIDVRHDVFPVYGACCDDDTGVCLDFVPVTACPPPMRFSPDMLCAELDPACGQGGGCPDANIVEAFPPTGEVDARVDHPSNALTPCYGIGMAGDPIIICLNNADGGLCHCFELCETYVDENCGPNAIETCVDLGGGCYELTLRHGISAPGVTTIQYDGGDYVFYYHHPANVDGSAVSNLTDVIVVIDNITATLNGMPTPLWVTDIDASGTVSLSDLLVEIDLLNGANLFDVWMNTPLPDPTGCP